MVEVAECLVNMGCIEVTNLAVPKQLIDTSTLSLTYDNQGMVNLQIAIITKETDPITSSCFTMSFDGGTFSGFVQSDSPRKLEGTEYIEHTILARGMVC